MNLALSNPTGGVVDFQTTAVLKIIDNDLGDSRIFWVTNTRDSGQGSLRQAILDANAHAWGRRHRVRHPRLDWIPISTCPSPGFDPVTQTWKIMLQSGLPTITDQVTIDGYTQAHFPMPFRYPNAFNTQQIVKVTGHPTGGSFTLSTQSPLTVLTTGDLQYDATAADVVFELVQIFGFGNVTVTGGPANVSPFTISFIGKIRGRSLPPLVPTNQPYRRHRSRASP